MKRTALYLTALAALGEASPLVPRQDIDFSLVDSAPEPTTVSIAIGATSQVVTYNLAQATASATGEPLPVQAVSSTASITKRRPDDTLVAKSACYPQPTGSGPVPSPDTASVFLAFDVLASSASAAPVPTGYSKTFTNLNGSVNAYGYMGMTALMSYDPSACATQCTSIDGCVGFNIFFERDPTVEPGTGCDNPASTNVIKCTFWGGYVAAENAKNTGQWRYQFQVVIAGSNGYMTTATPSVPGYTGTSLGNAAINAPLDCNGQDAYMGSKIFTTSRFDAGLCAAACESQNQYNTAHPPSTGSPQICKFFNTYLMAENGNPQGQYCAMYTEPWDASYAKNDGQWRGSDHYTIGFSFSYSNNASPGKPVCPADIAYLQTSGADFCSSFISYNTPTATVTNAATSFQTVTTFTTIVDSSTVTNYVTITSTVPANAAKRDAIATPAFVANWEAASLSAACSQVATGTLTATATSKTTLPTTLVSVIHQQSIATTTATSVVLTTAVAAASPSSIVSNSVGGFESGTLSPWFVISDGKSGGVTNTIVAAPAEDINGGQYCIEQYSSYYEGGWGDTNQVLGLNLQTVAGKKYSISFQQMGQGGGSNVWSVTINGATSIASGTTGGDGNWKSFSGTFIANANDQIRILASSQQWGIGTWYYDNFVVTAA